MKRFVVGKFKSEAITVGDVVRNPNTKPGYIPTYRIESINPDGFTCEICCVEYLSSEYRKRGDNFTTLISTLQNWKDIVGKAKFAENLAHRRLVHSLETHIGKVKGGSSS